MTVDFITFVNRDKLNQLDREYFKERPKYRPTETPFVSEETNVRRPPPAITKPLQANPPYSHFMQPPLPFDNHPAKKEVEESKGPSALERALMESTQENQSSSTLEKLLQEKVIDFVMHCK